LTDRQRGRQKRFLDGQIYRETQRERRLFARINNDSAPSFTKSPFVLQPIGGNKLMEEEKIVYNYIFISLLPHDS